MVGTPPGRPVNPPEGPPVEWCDHCERDVIEGALWDHDDDCPRYREPPKPPCSICNPRPNEHRHHGPRGSGPVFCYKHDRDDWQAQLEYEAEIRKEAIAREEARRAGRR